MKFGYGFFLSGIVSLGVVSAGTGLGAIAVQAQVVKAPRYQGNIEAPTRQLDLPPLPKAITPNGTVVEDVVVRVNNQIISRSDVERTIRQLQQDAQQNNMGPSEVTEAQKNLLRDMIDQQLLLSKAKELGLNVDSDVIRQLDDVRKKNNMGSLEELAQAAQQQGVNFEDFKAKIRDQILTQSVVRDQVGRRLQVTQGEEQKFYDAHKAEFQQPEQVRLSEILVPLPENATPAEIAQAERKANGIKSEVMQGADFAALAKKDSGGPTAAQGGELGLFKRGQLAKVLEDQTFGLGVGETTQPVRTRQGFVILKVTGHDQAGAAPLSAIEPQVQEAIYMQQMQPALRAYLTKLREEAYIDVEPGFVDSGASANETKPIFTAYAPPPSKKKAAKQTVRFEGSGRFATAKPVLASPDTTGTRTLTGKEAAPLIDPKTGLAQIPGVNVASNSRQRKLKREKIRFGQAPRQSLDGGAAGTSAVAAAASPAQTPVAGSQGPGSPAVLGGGTMAAPAPAETAASDNPLAPAPAPRAKSRFASKVVEVKARKTQTLTARAREKAIETPTPASSEEKAAAKVQAAPLGLAGNTAAKKKRPKRVKGAPKVRLEDKPVNAAPTAAPIAPTANPALAPNSSTPTGRAPINTPPSAAQPANSSVPTSVPNTPNATTLPPATAPPAGSPPQGQPVPGTNPPQ